MIIQTPYAAFGYVILKNEIEAGHIFQDELFKNGIIEISDSRPNDLGNYGKQGSGYAWLYTKGSIKWTDVYQKTTVTRSAGWSNLNSSLDSGIFKQEVLEPSVVFCFSPIQNSSKFPKIAPMEYFSLMSGNSQVLTKGTKLFLADGILQTNGTTLQGPRQVSVTSGDITVTANQDCYGFLFI